MTLILKQEYSFEIKNKSIIEKVIIGGESENFEQEINNTNINNKIRIQKGKTGIFEKSSKKVIKNEKIIY